MRFKVETPRCSDDTPNIRGKEINAKRSQYPRPPACPGPILFSSPGAAVPEFKAQCGSDRRNTTTYFRGKPVARRRRLCHREKGGCGCGRLIVCLVLGCSTPRSCPAVIPILDMACSRICAHFIVQHANATTTTTTTT